jgi:hypothetical protein
MTSPWNTLVILAYFDLSRPGLSAKGRHMASHLLGTILVIDDEPSMAGTPWPSSRSDTMT